ncbi:hypothetical protein B0H13DRAFT_1591292, partial [Mycena leptocephala]
SKLYTLHGFDPILPFDLAECTFLVEGWKSNMTHTELLALRTRQTERRPADLKEAADRLLASRIRSKEEFERRYAATTPSLHLTRRPTPGSAS